VFVYLESIVESGGDTILIDPVASEVVVVAAVELGMQVPSIFSWVWQFDGEVDSVVGREEFLMMGDSGCHHWSRMKSKTVDVVDGRVWCGLDTLDQSVSKSN
jgi:hypothetical protein